MLSVVEFSPLGTLLVVSSDGKKSSFLYHVSSSVANLEQKFPLQSAVPIHSADKRFEVHIQKDFLSEPTAFKTQLCDLGL